MTPTTTRSRAGSTLDAAIAGVEVELSLLARHQLRSSRHTPRRALDRSAYQLLGRLEHGPLSLRQLAEAFGLDQSTVNRQVNALLRGGLVEKVTDPEGGLARLLRPTRRGRTLLRRDRAVAQDVVGRVLDGWPGRDVEHFQQLLERFNRSIERLEGSPWPRG